MAWTAHEGMHPVCDVHVVESARTKELMQGLPNLNVCGSVASTMFGVRGPTIRARLDVKSCSCAMARPQKRQRGSQTGVNDRLRLQRTHFNLAVQPSMHQACTSSDTLTSLKNSGVAAMCAWAPCFVELVARSRATGGGGDGPRSLFERCRGLLVGVRPRLMRSSFAR